MIGRVLLVAAATIAIASCKHSDGIEPGVRLAVTADCQVVVIKADSTNIYRVHTLDIDAAKIFPSCAETETGALEGPKK